MRVSIGAEEPQSIAEASVQGHLQRVVAGVGGGVLKELILKDVGVAGSAVQNVDRVIGISAVWHQIVAVR